MNIHEKAMKRLLSILAIVAATCLPMQADSYHDLLGRYMAINEMGNTAQYEKTLEQLSAQAFPNDPQAAQCFASYLTTQLSADMVAIYEPVFRRHVTEAELRELVDLYNDPKFTDIQKRSMAIVNGLQQQPEYVAYITQYSQAIEKILDGQKPQEIQIADEVSREYTDAFYTYYRGSGVDEVIMSAFRGIFQNMEDQLRTVISDPQTVINELTAYTSRSMPKILMTIYSKTLTLDDLHLLAEATNRDSYKHTMAALADAASNPMALGVEVFRGMARWAEQNCPDYAAPLKEVLKSLEAMGK